MSLAIEQRIEQTKLTKTGRLIADFILQNKSAAVFMSSDEIASQLNTSDVSIIRFSRAIGFKGFAEMKKQLQEELLHYIDNEPEGFNTISKFVLNKEMNRPEHFINLQNAIGTYTNIITKTIKNNDANVFYNVAEQLFISKNKYFVGLQSRAGAVENFATILRPLLPNIFTITSGDLNDYLNLLATNKDDCIVFLSFGRTTKFEHTALEIIRKSHSFVIVITDQITSSIAKSADLLIYSPANAKHIFYSNLSNVLIAEIITNIIATEYWDNIKERISDVEAFLNERKAN